MAGVISKLREKVGIVILLIGLSMVVFILTDLFRSGYALWNPNVVGEVAGERLEYSQFMYMVEQQITVQEQATGRPVDEEQRQMLIATVWEQWVNDILLQRELEPYGVDVPGNELHELFVGPDPDPLVVQIFSQGGMEYDPVRVQQILSQASQNPQLAIQLRQIEDYVYRQRLQTKFFKMIVGGIYYPLPYAKRNYLEEHTTREVKYLAINYGGIPDTVVQPTEEDYLRYYNEHKQQFIVEEPEVVLQYVRFNKTPTAEDTHAVYVELSKLIGDWMNVKEDSSFAVFHTEDREKAYLFQAYTELPPYYQAFVDTARPGTIVGPVFDFNGYRLLKYNGEKEAPFPALKLRHILIRVQQQDTMPAKKLADSLVNVVNETNFQEVCAKYSEDMTTRFMGGELGWYRQGQKDTLFEKAIRDLKKGEKKVIRSNEGFHVVLVEDRVEKKHEILTIFKQIYPSEKTLNQIQRRADAFRAKALEKKDLVEAATEQGYDVRITPPITPSKRQIPGFRNAKELTAWALSSEEKEISSLFDLEEAYVVAMVKTKIEEGYKPMELVKNEIERPVINRKKAEYIVAQLKQIQANTLEAYEKQYKERFQGYAFVSTARDVSFSSRIVPGLGNDPILLGAIFAQPLNQISKPIEGLTGVYIIQVLNEKKGEESDEETLREYQKRQTQLKRNLYQGKVYQGIREAGKIKDYRYRFGL